LHQEKDHESRDLTLKRPLRFSEHNKGSYPNFHLRKHNSNKPKNIYENRGILPYMHLETSGIPGTDTLKVLFEEKQTIKKAEKKR